MKKMAAKRIFVSMLTVPFLLVIPVIKGKGQTISLLQERHLANIRQLTFEGKNAEAYFSFDGKKLIFQSTRDGNSISI
jgi:Tol biopolymer transport system component